MHVGALVMLAVTDIPDDSCDVGRQAAEDKERRGADGEEFSGFISGEFSLYGSYTDLIMRQRGE